MTKTILITGATDGIGLEAAKILVEQGHHVLLHGRNRERLSQLEGMLADIAGSGSYESYLADLSRMDEVEKLANQIIAKHDTLDVLINNAGVLKTASPITPEGLDVRFVVNTFAPYLLTQRLLPLMAQTGRVVNLSSAAQSPVNLEAMAGGIQLQDMDAYAQSKLAITMWSRHMALSLGDKGPMVVAVNPGSLLATKMVKKGFNIDGKDVGIGADILVRAALSDEFSTASGQYFDNDSGQFAPPHADGLDQRKCLEVVKALEVQLKQLA